MRRTLRWGALLWLALALVLLVVTSTWDSPFRALTAVAGLLGLGLAGMLHVAAKRSAPGDSRPD